MSEKSDSVDSIIEKLRKKSHTIDQKSLDTLKDILDVDHKTFRVLSNHLDKLGFKDHENLAFDLCKLDTGNVLGTVIKYKLKEEDLKRQEKFNLVELAYSKGIILGIDVLKKLRDHTPNPGNKIIGKGETLARVLTHGTSIETGDVLISDKNIEIKYNSAKLRGAIGFDMVNAECVAKSLDKNMVLDCAGIGFDAMSMIGTDPARWNFRSGRNSKLYLFNEIVKKSGIPPLTACKTLVRAFREYYTQMTDSEESELAESLSAEFELPYGIKDRIGYSDFIYKLAAYSLKYYAKVENFHGMLVMNDEFTCMYITQEYIQTSSLETLSKFIHKNLKIRPPSLTPKAGIRGSCFGIEIKRSNED